MNEKDVSKLMDKFEHSNLNEFRVANGDSSIYFSKLDRPGAVANQTPSTSVVQPKSHVNHATPQSSRPAKPSDRPQPTSKPAAATIKAPLVGIVYFAPNPKKPAFAKVGTHVSKGDVVCQIEAMKVLNNVKAPCSGVITKRLVKNGSMVQYHQPVFAIKKD